MLCSEAIAVNIGGFEKAAAIMRCKRWSCELCNPMNRWQVIKAACRGQPNTLITFTCQPANYSTPDEAARAMKKALVALRKAMQRERGYPHTPMLVVFEKHESGWPHMHILARSRWIDQAWLSATWARLTGAWCVDIRRIQDGGRAAKYVAKYLGKDLAAFVGCKRWWRTHDYQVEKEDRGPKIGFGLRWTRALEWSWESVIRSLERDFIEVVELRPGYVHWREWSG